MASKIKQEKGAKQDVNSPEQIIDALTKEEKEALLNKKMEEIRKRNEERQRRYAQIEADRKAAEQMGRAVSLKPTGAEVSDTTNRKNADADFEQEESSIKVKLERRKSDSKSKPSPTDGKVKSASYRADARQRPENATDQRSAATTNRKRQNDEQSRSSTKQNTMKGVRDKESQPSKSMGRGKRLTQMSQQKLKAEEYEKSKQEATAETDSKKTPPPDPGYKFLADPRREKSLPDSSRGESTRRHPRNFGGTNFDNVKNKIKAEKEKYGRFQGGPLQTELDMTLQMTGRERREYAQWRAERERIDRERLQRQKSAEGMWRREWDVGKKEQSPPTPPMSRKMEPGRRPAGRIGSGRFAAGEPDERPLKGQRDESSAGRGRPKRGRETAAIWSRGRGSDSYQTRGGRGARGARQSHSSSDSMENTENLSPAELNKAKPENTERSPKRFRLSSQGSDDSSRQVKQKNDKLVIQIDNEFASSKSPPTDNKPFLDFVDSKGKDFTFQLPSSSSGPVKFDGFHGKPSSRENFRSGRQGGRGRGRGERRRSMDRKGKSGKPGHGKTVTFQTQPVVHTPDLEWDHDPGMKQNGAPASDWKKDLAEASAQNWNVCEDAAKSWETEAGTSDVAECDGEYMEDHYIMTHEEPYTDLKKKRSKPKKRKAKVLPKPKPKEITCFVDENGEPIDEKDADWLDEEELVTSQVEDDGEVADNELHDSSAESLERFIQEHTLQLNIDARTGDISLENSLPGLQQSGTSEQSPCHQLITPKQTPPPQLTVSSQKSSSMLQAQVEQNKQDGITAESFQKTEDNIEMKNKAAEANPVAKQGETLLESTSQAENGLENVQHPSAAALQDGVEKNQDSDDEVKSDEIHNTSSNVEDKDVSCVADVLPKHQDSAEVAEDIKKDHTVPSSAEDLSKVQSVSEVAEDASEVLPVSNAEQRKEADAQYSDGEGKNNETSSSDLKTTETESETDKLKETSSGLEKIKADYMHRSSDDNVNTRDNSVIASDTDVHCKTGGQGENDIAQNTDATKQEAVVCANEDQETKQKTGHPADAPAAEGGGNKEDNKDVKDSATDPEDGNTDESAVSGAAEKSCCNKNDGKEDAGDNQQIQAEHLKQQQVASSDSVTEAPVQIAPEQTSMIMDVHDKKDSVQISADSVNETRTAPVQDDSNQNASPEKQASCMEDGDASCEVNIGSPSSEKIPETSNQLGANVHPDDAVHQQPTEDQTSDGQNSAPVESQ